MKILFCHRQTAQSSAANAGRWSNAVAGAYPVENPGHPLYQDQRQERRPVMASIGPVGGGGSQFIRSP
ncbi:MULTISPECIES: hypothetical protein [unclassified Agrobacterium]|uniref:hypothetical protein n=1 Tax=unclassified Agrobacterium TaxID=2632611 RepID=UPI002447A575|nr:MULTISPECIES: hypothetical protein [unclassified Agrobacterium]MDH0612537.1 hypothetical protein [Agrobacterium sp. GD03872]MDH0696434.1 hypothetical protein [Agrobacterium sp. GD03871]MDH1059336.1 hypothetical protein [Agrobacterium sp. GD03992]MDH2210697.1 hypothetical protein [Agrobacterium sp. GD03643]MDH2218203.1 hypothetical protein [Agrobacterium sp. GD03638]